MDVYEAVTVSMGMLLNFTVLLLLKLYDAYATLSAQLLLNPAMDLNETLHKDSKQYEDVQKVVNFCSTPIEL